MKNWCVVIASAFLLYSCGQKSSYNQDLSLDSNSLDIFGEWYMVEYFDSTVKNKKIHEYSWNMSSVVCKIKIERHWVDLHIFQGYIDSIYCEGNHEFWKDTLTKIDKNTFHLGSSNFHYNLVFSGPDDDLALHVNEYYKPNSKQKADPKIYEFHRNKKSIDDIELYFAKNIFAGKYYDSLSNKTIILGEDLSLQGLDSLEKYSIQLDFWDMSPQMDMLTLTGPNLKKGRYLNWRFENNKLILSSIIELYDETKEADCEMGNNYLGAKVDKVEYVWNKIE